MHGHPRSGRRRAAALACLAGLAAAAVGVGGCGAGPHTASGPARSGAARPPTAPAWNPHPASVAALGDSITRGFDACGLLTDCPADSWATGSATSVLGVAARLLPGGHGRTWNDAVSGARMADLPAQAERAAAQHPGLVTVLMGANDACRPTVAAMTPVAEFRTRFTSAMRVLSRDAPGTEVYVASIPDLYRLWQVGRADPVERQIWRLGICPSMLDDPMGTAAADTARRNAVRARVVAYNQVLGQVCGAFPRCRYDGGAVFRQAFGTADLSRWDWFHPSPRGQRLLAWLAYRGVTGASGAPSAPAASAG